MDIYILQQYLHLCTGEVRSAFTRPVLAFRFDMILISLKLILRCCGVCGLCTRLFQLHASKDVCFLLIFASLQACFLSKVSSDRDKCLDVSKGTGECYVGENLVVFQNKTDSRIINTTEII